MIELRDAGFYYDEKSPVLEHVTARIGDGEFVVLLGGSGCGKSTLLSLIAGLNHLKSGSIEIDGQKAEGPSGKMGICFQSDSLFPWMTVEGNIRFGIRQAFRDMKKDQVKKRTEEYLHMVGMEGHASKYPAQLSGGMRQRTALARLMAMDREILLLDEPFASLDPKIRLELSGLLEKLWQTERGEYGTGRTGETGRIGRIGRAGGIGRIDGTGRTGGIGRTGGTGGTSGTGGTGRTGENSGTGGYGSCGRNPSGKKTIVFVTHDVDEAILLADRILFMGEKNIEAEIRIPFQRPRGVDTIFNEEEYCIIRKQVIDLYYRHGKNAEGGKQYEDEFENSGTSSGDSAPCTCCGSGRM